MLAVFMLALCVCADTTSISSPYLPSEDICGVGTSQRISGGEETEVDEFPWMALLEYDKGNGVRQFKCGGVLISERYVLTAAHCATEKLVNVILGEHNTEIAIDCTDYGTIKDCAPAPVNITVENKTIHEDFEHLNINQYNDIALLRLKQKVIFSDFVRPICLPTSPDILNKTYVGKTLVVAGWGATENRSESHIKLKVNLPVVKLRNCRYIYRSENIDLKDGQMCAGGERGRDSCIGDSGGPLMAANKNKNREVRWYAVGLVSMGKSPCGKANWPGVYTDISKYMEWIVGKLKL